MPNQINGKLLILALSASALATCCGCRRPDLRVAHMVQPDYPLAARIKNLQGTVELGITIEIDGKVSGALGSGADPILVEAAEKNARQWIWGPFPSRFQFPYYQEIQYVYELQGNPKAVVIVPPMVNTDLPDRIEIIATRFYDDHSVAPLPVPQSNGDDACRYIKSRDSLAGYENGGPYSLDPFRLTKGRTDLREFLWTHWHDHKKAVAEARVGTVDRGIVTVLYLIQPDAKGLWGIDVALDRPMDPPCLALRADSLVRVPIAKPDEDFPSQTLDSWSPDALPQRVLSDSDVEDAKLYRVILVREHKRLTDEI